MINASERQLWSGLTRLEISLREESRSGRTVGRGRGDASTSLAR